MHRERARVGPAAQEERLARRLRIDDPRSGYVRGDEAAIGRDRRDPCFAGHLELLRSRPPKKELLDYIKEWESKVLSA